MAMVSFMFFGVTSAPLQYPLRQSDAGDAERIVLKKCRRGRTCVGPSGRCLLGGFRVGVCSNV